LKVEQSLASFRVESFASSIVANIILLTIHLSTYCCQNTSKEVFKVKIWCDSGYTIAQELLLPLFLLQKLEIAWQKNCNRELHYIKDCTLKSYLQEFSGLQAMS